MAENSKNTRRPSNEVVVAAEYRLLNALIKKPEFRDDSKISVDLFSDVVAQSIFEAIYELADEKIEITPASLFQRGASIDFGVTESIINKVFSIDEDGASTLDDIIPPLLEAKDKYYLLNKLEDIRLNLQRPGNINTEEVLKSLYEIDDRLNTRQINSPIITMDQWIDNYEDELEQRRAGKKYSYGDMFLDEFLYKGAVPGSITTAAATTGSGKSLFALNIINNLINMNSPCIYLSLEMGEIDTFDRLVSLRCGIPSGDLYLPENIDSIYEAVEEERQKLKNNKNFYFCEDPGIDITKLRSIIREFKHRTKQDYAFIVIDLLTMMREFKATANSNMANSIEIAMNELSALAKTENVHIFGVVQFGRQADNIKIHSIEELNELRPNLNAIKNANAIAERSRVVLGLFHPKLYVDKYLVPLNAPGCENFEDTIEVQILKNSNGSAGKIFKYMLIPEQFKLMPIEDEVEKRMDELSDITYNF